MKNIVSVLFSMILILSFSAQAQIKTPAASPSSTITQSVGLSEITVEYSRPSKKGREIFGGLVPLNKMWRTGANASTKITFSKPVIVGDHEVPAGKYALYTIPGDDTWTIIFHKNLTYWGTGGDSYETDEDVARFKIGMDKLSRPVETFTIGFSDLTASSAILNLEWDMVRVPIKISMDVESVVMKNIDKVMAGPGKNDYYAAARYYYDSDKDMEKALGWIKKANASDQKFWMMSLQAQIEGKMGKKKDAISSATKAVKLAETAGNDSYVQANKKRIAKWSKK